MSKNLIKVVKKVTQRQRLAKSGLTFKLKFFLEFVELCFCHS